jgi:hypothetical protein
MIELKKKYQLWIRNGCEGYSYAEYNTLKECLEVEKYSSDFVITKRVDYEIKERSENE